MYNYKVNNSVGEFASKVKESVSIATSLIAADSTYAKYPYRSALQAWSGLTSAYKPDSSLSPTSTYEDIFAIESVTGGYYVYFASMPADTIVFSFISMQKSISV